MSEIAKINELSEPDELTPGLTGIELAIRVRTEIPTCKVLLFSGHIGARELIEEAKASGHSFNLVEKLIHPTKLAEAIQNL
jgi:hypothetical protein